MNSKIDDVARLAGVSVPTVSRVINKTKYVSPDLEKRVLKAIKELNYLPNDHAKDLASKTSNVIGLIIPTFDEINISYFLNSCSRVFDRHKYDLMICKTNGKLNDELKMVDIQLNSRVSGIIFMPNIIYNKVVDILKDNDVPTIFICNEDPANTFYSIIFDNFNASRSLIEKIKDAEKKKYIILTGPINEISIQHRINGFKKAFSNLDITDYHIIESDGTIESGYEESLKIFDTEKKAVLLCTNDYMAVGALRAAYEKHISIPDEFEITGFSTTIYSEICSPSLTTIKFNYNELGEKTASTILQLINNQECNKLEILDFEIISGNSCILI